MHTRMLGSRPVAEPRMARTFDFWCLKVINRLVWSRLYCTWPPTHNHSALGARIMNFEKKTAANVKQAVPFFRVSNMKESLRYYIDGLGFEMTKKWIDDGKLRWCWLEIGEAALMLQEFRKEGHDSWNPSCKVGEGASIYFVCEDALAIYRDAATQGIKVSRNPFVGNRMWVVPFADPDGYRIYFESRTDVPEETEYSPQHH